jgi:thiamine biosynthesis lipoprotein
MLAAIHRAGRLTGGRFDASVLADLERIGEHGADLGGAAAGDPKAAAVDPTAPAGDPVRGEQPERVVLLVPRDTPRARLVRVPAAPVDSGGIGKGLALRWAGAAAIARLPDGSGLLLEAGGDITSAGRAPADGWPVGIEDPAAASADAEPVAVVALDGGSVATSSVRHRNWVGPDGRRVHHLLDPRTGEPARTGLIAVTVASPDPAWSEVWSKALFLAGRAEIGDEARGRGLAAWWVDADGRLGMTPEARVRCTWVAEERIG